MLFNSIQTQENKIFKINNGKTMEFWLFERYLKRQYIETIQLAVKQFYSLYKTYVLANNLYTIIL